MKKTIIIGSVILLITPFFVSAQTTSVCQPGDKYNSQTGALCTQTTSMSAVCANGALFNSMTGAPCNSIITSTNTTSLSSTSQQTSFSVSSDGQYFGLPIFTTYVTTPKNINLRTLTMSIESSGQGSITNAYLYEWNQYAGTQRIATGVITNGIVTFTNNPTNDQLIALGSSPTNNTLIVKVDVSGLNTYGNGKVIRTTVLNATAVDSLGRSVNVVPLMSNLSGNVAVANTTIPTPIVTANPMTIENGGTSTISWVSTNSTSCTLNSSPVLLAPTGSESTGNLYTSTTYTVTCSGAYGSGSDSVIVNVQPIIYPPSGSICAKMMDGYYTNFQQTQECYQEYPITTKG